MGGGGRGKADAALVKLNNCLYYIKLSYDNLTQKALELFVSLKVLEATFCVFPV